MYTLIDTHQRQLGAIDEAASQIKTLKTQRPDLWPTIEEKLRVDWTYDSNAIEGSTLTRGETLFFLREGLTVEGRPFKDFVDAKNHAAAIDFLMDVVIQQRPLTTGLVKELNALILDGITHTKAKNELGQLIDKPATPGQYKTQPNHVLQADGSIHTYTKPLQVASEMDQLMAWITSADHHPAIVAAVSHYNLVRIHPFDDGNGRVARLLMNVILMQAQYQPAIIRNETRRDYITTLSHADNGNLDVFISFVLAAISATQATILSDLT